MSFSSIQVFNELPKRLFIEASAGTGKTFSIVHLMCQHILSYAKRGEVLPMEEIACITFTRAVAHELQSRLKSTLSSIKQSLERKTVMGIPYVDELFLTPRLIPSCLRALRQAIFDIDLAAISTIHGFSDRLIEGFKEHVGSQEVSRWIPKSRAKMWLIDCLEHGQLGPFLSLYEWKGVKKYFKSNSEKALDWFLEVIQSEQKEGVGEKSSLRLLEMLHEVRRKEFPSLDFQELVSLLLQVSRSFEGVCDRQGAVKEDVRVYLEACAQLIFEKELEPLWIVHGKALSWDKIFSKRKKKTIPLTDGEGDLWARLSKMLFPKLFTLIDVEKSLDRVGAYLRDVFQAFATSKGLKTPDFLIESLTAFSEKKDFQLFAQQKYRLVIIDEFQDTDPIQWAIMNRLFVAHDSWQGSFLLVGDPKQSIYSFRHADMYSYLEAKRAFFSHELASLQVNYRASYFMVEALNRLFSSKDNPLLFFLPKERTALLVEEIVSSQQKGIEVPIIMKFFDAHNKGRWPSQREEEEELFPWIFSCLLQEKQKGISFEKIAILVKDRYQAERVRRVLLKNGVDAILKRGERIIDTLAFSWLKEALAVVLSPKKKQAYLDLLLRVPSKETLEAARLLKVNEDPFFFAYFVETWQKGRFAYEKEGFSGLLSHLFSCPISATRNVFDWIQSFEDYEQWMLDFEQMVELMEEKENKHLCLEEIINHLQLLEEDYADDEGMLFRRADPKNQAVSIVTMHSSKGLEFHVVILLGASVRSSAEEEPCETVAEKIRQFYVSVTRAKERCYVPIPLFQENGLSPIEAYFGASLLNSPIEGLSWSQEVISGNSKEKIQERVQYLVSSYPALFSLSSDIGLDSFSPVGNIEKRIEKKRPITVLPVRWTTYSALKAKRSPPLKQYEKSDMPHGSLWGLQIHRALYEILKSHVRPQREADVISFCPKWLVDEREKETFLKEIWSFLTSPLPLGEQKVMPLELSSSSLHLEHSFYYFQEKNKVGRDPFFGTFDMVIMHEGKVFIVDWKTNEEPSKLTCEALRHFIEEEGYDIQAVLYKEAALQLFHPKYEWGGFFFVFSKHRNCPQCHGVYSWI